MDDAFHTPAARVPAPDRHANGRFAAGNTGKPRGSVNRLTREAATAILEDFVEHRAEFLREMRLYKAPVYSGLVRQLLPRKIEIELEAEVREWSPGEVRRVIWAARAALDRIEDGRGSLDELQALLTGEGEVVSEDHR